MSCFRVSCFRVSCFRVSCFRVSCSTVSCSTVSCSTVSCSTVSCSTVTCSTPFQRFRSMTEKDHENRIRKRIRKKWEKQEELHEDSLLAFNVITGERCGGHHVECCSGHHSPAVVKDGDGVILTIRIDLPSTLINTLRSTDSLLP